MYFVLKGNENMSTHLRLDYEWRTGTAVRWDCPRKTLALESPSELQATESFVGKHKNMVNHF